ncbi:DUF262 domain-containing protein [Algibacter pacificus]|uniref:DUF262 domain-containing protein n=1 Tax=Algibacter pacificus TaxID=2599389 RepID=UPI0011C9CB2F|nr:DUF262 domain-containing protein [Algibacter pacificus]
MIQETKDKSLAQLFSGEHKITYHIPKYQREYIWKKDNWEALFDDVEESEGNHFLGSIICINTENDAMEDAKFELVDGQQRMTTISLLYLAVYKFLSDHLPENQQKEMFALWNLKNRILLESSNKPRLEPSYTNSNFEDYNYIFSKNIEEIRTLKAPKYIGNRQISRAFNYFIDRLYQVDENDTPIYTYQSAKNFLDKLNSSILVKIDVTTHDGAFTLFETLNNRGVPLSAIDLIKNKLLGALEKKGIETIDDNFDRWNGILANLTDNYKIQERFIRQFYNAFRLEESIKVNKKPKALRSNLIGIFEELINRDVSKIFDRLESASIIYSKNIQYETDDNSTELTRALRNLENVNGADAYMLLLFVEHKFEISELQKIELINLLCRYFIRRNVTDSPPTRDLTNYFMDIVEHIDSLETYNYENVKAILIQYGKPASNDVFEQKLNGNLYEENVGATRYILSSLELAQNNDREGYKNFYERSKNKFVWTIEHALPQGKNMKPHWVEMVADGDKEVANEIRESYVHKLGNLTLTGYNSQLSDMPLLDKQNKKDKQGNSIGFNNGLVLNEKLKDTPTWKKEHIQNRTETLVSKALEIFEL